MPEDDSTRRERAAEGPLSTPVTAAAMIASSVASMITPFDARHAGTLDGLRVEDLSFHRGDTPVVRGVHFHLPRGRLLGVVGPSGAGKSTLLALVAGFETPSAGRIRFDGIEWTTQDACARGIGMCFDDAALHEHLTVRENIDNAALARNEPRDRRHARVENLAHTLGVHPLLDRRPHTLSAGERRRVAVGRAFIRSPQLVLLDEPFANLDRANRFAIRQLIRELQRSTHAAAIVVTHDPTDALAIVDDLLVLIDGTMRAHGAASLVAAQPVDLEVAQVVDDLGMHVIELSALGTCDDAQFAPSFLEDLMTRRACAHSRESLLLGIRPWQIHIGAPDEPSIALDAKLIAREHAGVFTDLLALRHDGRVLRARVPTHEAQELPMNTRIRFHVRERDVHIFAGPFPGTRLAPLAQ